MKHLEQKEAFLKLLNEELDNCWHNARLDYPIIYHKPDKFWNLFDEPLSYFYENEINYLNEDLENPYKGKQMQISLRFKNDRVYCLLWDLQMVWGKFYCYGRSGATFLPEKLYKNRPDFDSCTYEELVELYQELVVFNKYVRDTCSESSIRQALKCFVENELFEIESDLNSGKKSYKLLKKEYESIHKTEGYEKIKQNTRKTLVQLLHDNHELVGKINDCKKWLQEL